MRKWGEASQWRGFISHIPPSLTSWLILITKYIIAINCRQCKVQTDALASPLAELCACRMAALAPTLLRHQEELSGYQMEHVRSSGWLSSDTQRMWMKTGVFKGLRGIRHPKHTGWHLIPLKTQYFSYLAEEISFDNPESWHNTRQRFLIFLFFLQHTWDSI